MLCEIWLDNQHRLYPGTFVHVTLSLVAPRSPVVDSGGGVCCTRQAGVAVVAGRRVHFVPVRPGLDDGKTVQIVEGLQGGRGRGARAAVGDSPTALVIQAVERHAGSWPMAPRSRRAGASDTAVRRCCSPSRPAAPADRGSSAAPEGRDPHRAGAPPEHRSGGRRGHGDDGRREQALARLLPF